MSMTFVKTNKIMKTTNYTQMTNEVLNSTKELTMAKIQSLTENYKTTINNHLKTLLPDWQVTHMNDGSIEIGFCIANEPHNIYHSVSIYFGSRFGEDKFEFNINPCCFGSFAIEEVSKQTIYYIGIGKLLSDAEFTSKLRSILFDFYTEKEKLYTDLYEIRQEERDRSAKQYKQLQTKELKLKIKESSKDLEQYEYVLIQKDTEELRSDIIYRNQPCRSLRYGTEFELHRLLNTEYRKCVAYKKLKVVATSKVRIANI